MVVTRKQAIKISTLLAVLLVLGFAVFGVYSLFKDDSSSGTNSSQQDTGQDDIDTDEPVSDIGDVNPQSPWNTTDDPQQIGTELASILDGDEGLVAIRAKINDFHEKHGTDFGKYTDEQNEEYTDLLDQLVTYKVDPYVGDEDVERYMTDQAAEIYLKWRNEYYDSEGNLLKPLPEAE